MNRIASCASLADVRLNIDRQLVGLIAEHGAYIRQAAQHPPTPHLN